MADGDKPQEKPEEQRYERDDLLEHSVSRYGVRPTTMAAALSLEDRKTHTDAQVKKLLAQVAKHEVPANEGTPSALAEEE